ncbi:TATA element modulatory factor 1 TATA binding-domain-containing protein, partial [Mycotypha africana]|uniref:TATA element modulatory factor 1 TATA binding-domain-containing protein n=1 Tax=Mycotypha africana TaxID=64632 RepID=UPI0023000EB2
SLIVRMQLAEAEHEKILQEENKLKDEIHDLRQLLEASECKLKELQSTADGLKRQAEEDEKIKKDLKEKIELLMKEKQEQNERELKNQEGLKIQYQRLIKERLSEERKQFELNNAAPSASSISGGAGLVEKLQANLRRLENQVNFYQTQLQNASQSRGELSEEVLHLTQEIDQLRKDAKKSEDLEHEYKDLHARYQTSLELLGERTEEVQELKADLQDVKEMYKSQIVELVQKIDQLSSPSKK